MYPCHGLPHLALVVGSRGWRGDHNLDKGDPCKNSPEFPQCFPVRVALSIVCPKKIPLNEDRLRGFYYTLNSVVNRLTDRLGYQPDGLFLLNCRANPLAFSLVSYPCACTAVIAATLTISSTEQPRDRSLIGLASPCITGPTASAPATRSTSL